MSTTPALGQAVAAPAFRRLALPVFAATIFASAFLLFAVQPMFTKMILPKLGGTPAVWSVATVFFQAVLLAGYGYAHLVATRLSPRRGALVHLALMAAVIAIALPIGIPAGFERPPADGQAMWLIATFAASVGLPFFALSANGPLLQAWFARTGHESAADPYMLYAASNLGSLLALLAYPFLLEPWLPLERQGLAWAWGFAALIAAIAASAGYAAGGRGRKPTALATSPAPTWSERARWIGLAFVPSALLVAVTAHIGTDVASAPLLWVIPLALFLLTFVITFQRRPILPHALALRLQPLVAAPTALLLLGGVAFSWRTGLPLHLLAFFLSAMVCHGELVARRPAADRLTEFYVWMSVGGCLGGIFAALVAMHLFSTVLEYPLLLIAALACRPGLLAAGGRGLIVRMGGAGLLLAAAVLVLPLPDGLPATRLLAIALCVLALAVALQRRYPGAVLGLCVAGALVLSALASARQQTTYIRSFFGVHSIGASADGRFHFLLHGTTVHGVQAVRDAAGAPLSGRPEPLAYYHAGSGFAVALEALRAGRAAPLAVGLVGLGSGAMACHSRPGERWRAYEIDAAILRIARDPRLFTFIERCAPDLPIVLGDARLSLVDEPQGGHDVLIVDAFSSDSIPIHLLTREALALYVDKMSADGTLLLHVSNRYLELASVIAVMAAERDLVALQRNSSSTPQDNAEFRLPSNVVAVARRASPQASALEGAGFKPLTPRPDVEPWTDGHADLIGALWRGLNR